jgi:hypothetical protein
MVEILKSASIPADQLASILKKLGQGANVNKINSAYKSLGKDLDLLIKKQKELNGLLN